MCLSVTKAYSLHGTPKFEDCRAFTSSLNTYSRLSWAQPLTKHSSIKARNSRTVIDVHAKSQPPKA